MIVTETVAIALDVGTCIVPSHGKVSHTSPPQHGALESEAEPRRRGRAQRVRAGRG